jgi:hypothetical protein
MTELLEIYGALTKAQAEVKDPERRKTVKVKAKSGARYDFNYATLNQGLDIFREVFSKHGLAFHQGVVWVEGKPHIRTNLSHTSGEVISTDWPISGFDWNNPQSAGSATTYAKRYALFAIMGINGDDDDDANIAQGNEFAEKKKDNARKVTEEIKQKDTDKYDKLFDNKSYAIERGDMNESEFVYELARYAKRANSCDELDKLITDNIQVVSHFEDNVRKSFIRYLDANYKEIDEHAEFPAAMARSLS